MAENARGLRGRVGSGDRVQRIVIGVLLLVLTIVGILRQPDWLRFAALAVQVELLGTALAGWCPVLWSLGTNSCSIRDDPSGSAKK